MPSIDSTMRNGTVRSTRGVPLVARRVRITIGGYLAGPAWCVGLRLLLPHLPRRCSVWRGDFFLNLPRASVAGPPELAIERDRAPTTQSHASAPATRRPVLGCPYWKCIPSCLSVRQIALQARVVCPGRPNRNVDGTSKVALTSREAPDSVKLRTVHGSTAFFPRTIVPDLRARRRGVFRRSAIARK
jgi:hypothetical protein